MLTVAEPVEAPVHGSSPERRPVSTFEVYANRADGASRLASSAERRNDPARRRTPLHNPIREVHRGVVAAHQRNLRRQ